MCPVFVDASEASVHLLMGTQAAVYYFPRGFTVGYQQTYMITLSSRLPSTYHLDYIYHYHSLPSLPPSTDTVYIHPRLKTGRLEMVDVEMPTCRGRLGAIGYRHGAVR